MKWGPWNSQGLPTKGRLCRLKNQTGKGKKPCYEGPVGSGAFEGCGSGGGTLRHGLPEKRCLRVEEAGERCPLPSSCPPWYPPLAKPTDASARRVDSQSVGVTAGKVDRREQGGVEITIPFISVFFLAAVQRLSLSHWTALLLTICPGVELALSCSDMQHFLYWWVHFF